MTIPDRLRPDDLQGLYETDAETKIGGAGMSFRVGSRDGGPTSYVPPAACGFYLLSVVGGKVERAMWCAGY